MRFSQWKLWWVSRYREKTSYRIAHVFYRQREGEGALVWLGTGKEQAGHLVRLVRLGDGVGVRMYLTTVCDPQLLSSSRGGPTVCPKLRYRNGFSPAETRI